jgi:hypothetical protein
MNLVKELSRHLDRHNIDYEYQTDNDGDTIVIDFAEKEDNSKYPVDYQIIEITYSSETECFNIELSSTLNIQDYPLLHPAVHTIKRKFKLVDTQNEITLNASLFILATFISHYIHASAQHIKLFEQLQNI